MIGANDLPAPDRRQQGFGSLQKDGATRRPGVETAVDFPCEEFGLCASHASIAATFLNALALASSSPYADANDDIYANPSDHSPMNPRNPLKLRGDFSVPPDFEIDADSPAAGPRRSTGTRASF